MKLPRTATPWTERRSLDLRPATGELVPQRDPSFRSTWNATGNNDVGNKSQSEITQCLRDYSESLDEAIDCGMIEVVKGCHQTNDPHITINGKNKTRSKTSRCQRNMYWDANAVHIPCGSC